MRNLQLINLKCVTYAQPIPLSLSAFKVGLPLTPGSAQGGPTGLPFKKKKVFPKEFCLETCTIFVQYLKQTWISKN